MTREMHNSLAAGKSIKLFLRNLALNAKDWKESIALATLYGEFQKVNLIDCFFEKKFQIEILRKVPQRSVKKVISGDVHYITIALTSGGHTELFNNLIRAQLASGCNIHVISRRNSASLSTVRNLGVKVSIVETFEELLTYKIFGSLYVHANPSDIEGCIFADRMHGLGATVRFVNHADHCFHYRPLAPVEYLEVSGLGTSISKKFRQIKRNNYLGIPMSTSQLGSWGPSPEKFLLTVARREKLRPNDEVDFPRFADEIARRYSIPFMIIGQTGREPWWCRFRGNKLLLFKGITEPVDVLFHLKTCTAYIDSFPLTGGTVLAVAGGVGVPIFSVKSSAYGYNAVEAVRLDNINSLRQSLDRYLIRAKLHYDLNSISESVTYWHSMNEFQNRVSEIQCGKLVECPVWAEPTEISLDEVRKELFSKLQFPFEISHKISFKNRVLIILRVVSKSRHMHELSLQAFIISILGLEGQLHYKIGKIRRVFKEAFIR